MKAILRGNFITLSAYIKNIKKERKKEIEESLVT